MTAMHGFVSSTWSKGRLIGCCLAAALLVLALLASNASAAKTPLKPTAYVAIGDSLGFGYTQQKFEESVAEGKPGDPSKFEGGYANVLEKKLAAQEKKAGNALSLINLGCPGEISDGMIGHNPALGGYTYTPEEGETEQEKARNETNDKDHNPCAWHNVAGLPYHYEYGSVSQLEALVGILTTPGMPEVKNLTINMGSNDELKIVGLCQNPAYLTEQGFGGGFVQCLTVEAGPGGHFYPGGEFHHIIANIGDVIGVARAFGYTGKVEIAGFYNPLAEILPGSDPLQKSLNEAFEGTIASQKAKAEAPFGSNVAYGNPFPTINPGTKVEPARICKFTEECNVHDKKVNMEKAVKHPVTEAEAEKFPEGDIHATPKGYKLIARELFRAYESL